jgi:integrase
MREYAPLPLSRAMKHYADEHLIASGSDPRRIATVVKHAIRIWGPEIDVATIDRAAVRHYTATREAESAKPNTIRRELALVQAGLAHNHREERLPKLIIFVKPKAGAARMRWLTREEHRHLMLRTMPARIRLFLLIAFGMGMRSAAIEQLTWDRINWSQRTADFRVPGKRYKNKRRVVAPIGDALFRRLESAYARRDPADPFVIGRGGCTYRKVKAVMRSAGIDEDGVARHVARHTFCSWLVQAGVSYPKIGALVGDTAHMIEATYGHMAPEHMREAANLALLS